MSFRRRRPHNHVSALTALFVLLCTTVSTLSSIGRVDARPPFILPSGDEMGLGGKAGVARQGRVADSGSSSTDLPSIDKRLSSGSSSSSSSSSSSGTEPTKKSKSKPTTVTSSTSEPASKTTTTNTATSSSSSSSSTSSSSSPKPNRSVTSSITTTTTTTKRPPSSPTPTSTYPPQHRPIRVAYQGEPGAYSEKSLRELLGPNVTPVHLPDFDSCYRAVTSGRCDYACLPFENSLGGSIHENFDLMLRYDLKVVAEHDCRVSHCLHACEGVELDDVKYAMSHPQALAQCDGFLRSRGITPVPFYDTAGSVKLLAERKRLEKVLEEGQGDGGDDDTCTLPALCTTSNTAAIGSQLAGLTYSTNCLQRAIEDNDCNYTRFLLLAKNGVSRYLGGRKDVKTSIVFTLPNNSAGALYKALACFSLRDIDFSKIESRPTSASLLNYLRYKTEAQGYAAGGNAVKGFDSNGSDNNSNGSNTNGDGITRRFPYCFYLDFLASELDVDAQNALHHLREKAEFCRILGSYPRNSVLVGLVRDQVEEAKQWEGEDMTAEVDGLLGEMKKSTLSVGIIGFGAFGQLMGQKLVAEGHKVNCIDVVDKSMEADELGTNYYPMFEMESFLESSDVLILAVPQIEFETTVSSLPTDLLHGKLLVDVCPLSTHPKSVLLQHVPVDADIIVSNPMVGRHASFSQSSTWDGQPMVYEKVRIRNGPRADTFLDVFEKARCQMVEMSAEDQDAHSADADFVTHLTGRLLDTSRAGKAGDGERLLPPTPVASREYTSLLDVAAMTRGEPFDLFYGMFKFNPRAKEYLGRMRENLARIETRLAAKEAYLAAKAEFMSGDRQRLIAECRELFREVAASTNSRRDEGVGVIKDVIDGEKTIEGGKSD